MGDRYTWYEDCPKCKGKKTIECWDAPSCMIFSKICYECDWREDLNYYEEEKNCLVLISRKEAKRRGYFCEKCEQYLYPGFERKLKLCSKCSE